MKKRRKTSNCLNCGYHLEEQFEYCPICGQENHNNYISFGQLLNEFFSNYFSLDSRFGRSLKPFFFQPGKLTRDFMVGKRLTFANPIRLYLIVSLIHFFILSFVTSDFNIGNQKSNNPKADSIIKSNRMIDYDFSTGESEPMDLNKKFKKDTFTLEDRFEIISAMEQNGADAQTIYDSLRMDDEPFYRQYVFKQIIKILVSGTESIGQYILKNIPTLMFFLLPLYALILKIFFHRKLYIQHIIHSLHLHSFLFLVLSVLWLLLLLLGNVPSWVYNGSYIILFTYLVASFKNTYAIKIKTAIWKVLVSGFIYLILLVFAFVFEMLISILTF